MSDRGGSFSDGNHLPDRAPDSGAECGSESSASDTGSPSATEARQPQPQSRPSARVNISQIARARVDSASKRPAESEQHLHNPAEEMQDDQVCTMPAQKPAQRHMQSDLASHRRCICMIAVAAMSAADRLVYWFISPDCIRFIDSTVSTLLPLRQCSQPPRKPRPVGAGHIRSNGHVSSCDRRRRCRRGQAGARSNQASCAAVHMPVAKRCTC